MQQELHQPRGFETKLGPPPILDPIATVKSNYNAYLSLTGQHFSYELGDTTRFDYNRRTLTLGAQELQDAGINEPFELHLTVLRILGRLKEFRDDTEGYLALVRRCKADPSGEEIFRLYQDLMDIYGIRNTSNRAAFFGGGGDELSLFVREFYLNKLFPDHDLRSLPCSRQFRRYLLLTGTGIARAYTLSEPVKVIIDTGLLYAGRPLSYKDFIDTFLVPALGRRRTDSWQGTFTQRDALISASILPLFRRFLVPSQAVPFGELGQASHGKTPEHLSANGKSEHSPTDAESSTPLTQYLNLEEAEELLNRLLKEKSPQAELVTQQLMSQGAGIGRGAHLEQPSDFAERLVRVQPIVNKLVEEFLKIRIPRTATRCKLDTFTTSGALDIPQAIRRFGTVLNNPSHAEVFRKERLTRKIEENPITIRLCLLPDLSGSMTSRIDSLRDNCIALTAAAATLGRIYKTQGTETNIELAIYGFTDSLHRIMEPKPNVGLSDIAASYGHIQAGGGTSIYVALECLQEVLTNLKPRDQNSHRDRRYHTIALCLTDGETCGEARTIAAKDALLRAGVECFFALVGSQDQKAPGFDRIANTRGYRIGSLEELPNVISSINNKIFSDGYDGPIRI